MKNSIFVILIILLPNVQCLFSQNSKFISMDEKMSCTLINDLYEDRKGYIWIPTENGLNKFNGIKCTFYKDLLKSDYIVTLFEDSAERFWIGTSKGIQLYNRNADSFSDVKTYFNNKLVFPYIKSIIECSNNEIWIGTLGDGVITYSSKSIPKEIHTNNAILKLTNDKYIEYLFEDSQKRVWISCKYKGLFCYDRKKNTFQAYRKTDGSLINEATAISEDAFGTIFLSTRKKGLFKLNKNEKQFALIPYKNNYNSIQIKTLLADKQKGRLLIGTDGQGLMRYDYDLNTIVTDESDVTLFDFSKAKIHKMILDKNNNLWLALYQKGLILLPSSPNKFDYYGYKSGKSNCIGSCCIMDICVDKGKIIWVGTDNDGLYAINEEGKQLKHFFNVKDDPNSVPNTIECIYEDSENNLWVGSYLGGVGTVDRQSGKFTKLPELLKMSPLEGSNIISSIIEDDHKGLWMGTFESGLFRRDLLTGEMIHLKSKENDPNTLPHDFITCLIKDRKGLIWIGTYLGISCLDPQTKTIRNMSNINHLMNHTGVFDMIEDESGKLWIGTGYGLYCYTEHNKKLKHYTTNNGLPSNMICALQEDKNSDIWMSTHRGISRFNQRNNTFCNYNVSDGIQGLEFRYRSTHKDENGKIYFGGTNGITAFLPEDIVTVKRKLDIALSELIIFRNNKLEKIPIPDADKITLDYKSNTFSIEFFSLEYVNPERITYEYKIEELGKKWIRIPAGINNVNYTSLAPGTYTFKVRACDYGTFSEIRTLVIVIFHPWYSTWWATLIWIMIIAGICIYLYLSYKTHRKSQAELLIHKHQEEINEAKLQFFTNMSHELRTPLNLITGPLERLLSLKGEHNQTYRLMYRNAQRMLNLINQLLDIRKIDENFFQLNFEEVDLVKFIEEIVESFEYQKDIKQISFTFEHLADELKAWIDANNFDKILINVLSNAFKFTPEHGEIKIRLLLKSDEVELENPHDFVEIIIEDTGIGIDDDKLEKIFDRFYQVNSNLTQKNRGTGIGLHLCKFLVGLHNGTISAHKRDGGGSKFIIRIPQKPGEIEIKRIQQLHGQISVFTDSQTENNTEETKTPELNQRKRRIRILIVEDEADIRKYMTEEFSKDFIVESCSNGKEALEYILCEKPDLVISDLMMPKMDGITLCEKIKKNSNINHIPIILLTGKSSLIDQIQGLEIGADDFVLKPFNSTILRSKILNLVNNRELIRNKIYSTKQIDEQINSIELKSADELLMIRIMNVINDNISNPDFNVETLASGVGLSRVHLYRKLKEFTNQSARDFIRDIRLQQAGKLLLKKELSISDVVYAVGFTNASHFSTLFREYYGKSPKQYRDANENGRKESAYTQN